MALRRRPRLQCRFPASGARLEQLDTEPFAATDWQGQALACADCAQMGRSSTRCELAKACVHDRYARRIDRFFAWNPALAKEFLAHPYFEVRAVAAKHVEVFYLPRMIDDPDATVRWSVAQRLPQRQLLMLRQDPDREVRIQVARRLHVEQLHQMMGDGDYGVRLIVAQRIEPQWLVRMLHDEDREVRRVVAARVGSALLGAMAKDEDAAVRIVVAQRLAPAQLVALCHDPDWRVRYHVAERIDAAHLGLLADDEDDAVRTMALQRSGLAGTTMT